MFCSYCGKEIDERRIERKRSSFAVGEELTDKTKVSYVCPRCGHLVKSDLTEAETKSLSRAAHAELQRGRNFFASGMGNVSIGAILLILAFLFFLLARKPDQQFRLVTTSAEFFVSMVLFGLSAVLLVLGTVFSSIGFSTKVRYSRLLKDIKNKTFVQ